MSAQIIDGKAVAAKVRAQVKDAVEAMKQQRGRVPGLAVVRVGDDPASKIYVGAKRKAAEEIGFNAWECTFEENATQAEVLAKVTALN